MPQTTWSDAGWNVTLSPIAKGREARERRPQGRPIGAYAHGEAQFIDDASEIRAALKEKDSAYGPLDAPFVIAVGLYISDYERWGATNALYGHEFFRIFTEPDGSASAVPSSRNDGYFGYPGSWKHNNVGAILLINQLMPYQVLRADLDLWIHPAAEATIPQDHRISATTIALNDNELDITDTSIDRSGFFGLNADWPTGEAWPPT